jgi:hypothetical protein
MLGPGGYKKAIPKWDREEQELVARGIIPATLDWAERAKHYYFALSLLFDEATREG